MNILYIVNVDPRLKDHGNAQRTFALWNSLMNCGNVYTLCISQSEEEKLVNEPAPICFYNPLNHSNNWLVNFLYKVPSRLSGISFLPFYKNIYPFISGKFPGVKFDIIVTRYIYNLAQYHLWNIAPVFVDIDDHPVQLFDTLVSRRLPKFIRPLGKWLNNIQVKGIFSVIKGGWISNGEQMAICPQCINYLPNIPQRPSSHYNEKDNDRKYIFTIGNMEYSPNYLGVDEFLRQVWPAFHSKYPDTEYWICGKGLPEKYLCEWKNFDGVKYKGFVDDIEELYQHSLASIVPIGIGGGTCIKTLESMAFSRVCISTIFGVRGICTDTNEIPSGVLVYRTAEEFVNHFNNVVNPVKRQIIEKAGSEFIELHYSLDSFKVIVKNSLSEFIVSKYS